MGLIRKATSISTLGLVSYRTSGERAARYARQTRNAARLNNIQNMQMIELQRQQLEAETQAQVMRATQVAATQLQAPRQAPPALPPGVVRGPDRRAGAHLVGRDDLAPGNQALPVGSLSTCRSRPVAIG